jgi:hypothetical protein
VSILARRHVKAVPRSRLELRAERLDQVVRRVLDRLLGAELLHRCHSDTRFLANDTLFATARAAAA